MDAKKENPVIFICMQKLRDRGTSFYTIADFLTTDSENPNSVLFKSFFLICLFQLLKIIAIKTITKSTVLLGLNAF